MPRARFSTGWGIRRDRKAQRGTGAGGGGGSLTPEGIFGAKLIDYLDSEVGITLIGGNVQTVTTAMRGLTLSPTGAAERPAYGPVGDFNGRNAIHILQANNAGIQNLAISPPLNTIGNATTWILIGRTPSNVGVDATGVTPRFFNGSSVNLRCANTLGAPTFQFAIDGISSGAPFTATGPPTPHGVPFVVEFGMQSYINFAPVGIAYDGVIAANDIVWRNGWSGAPGFVASHYLFWFGVLNGAPTASERAQFRAFVNGRWGLAL